MHFICESFARIMRVILSASANFDTSHRFDRMSIRKYWESMCNLLEERWLLSHHNSFWQFNLIDWMLTFSFVPFGSVTTLMRKKILDSVFIVFEQKCTAAQNKSEKLWSKVVSDTLKCCKYEIWKTVIESELLQEESEPTLQGSIVGHAAELQLNQSIFKIHYMKSLNRYCSAT